MCARVCVCVCMCVQGVQRLHQRTWTKHGVRLGRAAGQPQLLGGVQSRLHRRRAGREFVCKLSARPVQGRGGPRGVHTMRGGQVLGDGRGVSVLRVPEQLPRWFGGERRVWFRVSARRPLLPVPRWQV
jgi:hypothetical protein